MSNHLPKGTTMPKNDTDIIAGEEYSHRRLMAIGFSTLTGVAALTGLVVWALVRRGARHPFS